MFALPEELRMMQRMVREFVDEELIPLEREVPEGDTLPPELRERLVGRTKELGLWAMDAPEELGGQGLGELAMVLVMEELARTVLFPLRYPSLAGGSPGILVHCKGEQRAKYLEPVIRGEKRSSFALTEPDAGSDAGSIKTRAVRDGDDYVINGRKIFISNVTHNDFIQLMAVTDPDKKTGGVTCFLIDRDTPGFEIVREVELMIPDRPGELLFDNCRVSKDQILGEEGQGFAIAMEWLTHNRLRHAIRCVGRAQRALEMAIEYAQERVTFGRPLSYRQGIQWMIAESATELHAARLAIYHAAWRLDQGESVSAEGPMVKILGNEAAWKTVDRCLQIFGGMGLAKELPIERMFREIRSMRITEGPVEIHKNRIARHCIRENVWPVI